MKYPNEQFEELKRCVSIIKNHIDVKSMNPNALHYVIYQQFSDGQPHNRLVVDEENNLIRQYTLVDNELKENKGKLLFDFELNFELYPNDTNDNHIITAVKKAIKETEK